MFLHNETQPSATMLYLAAGRSNAGVEICFLHIFDIKRDIPLQQQRR